MRPSVRGGIDPGGRKQRPATRLSIEPAGSEKGLFGQMTKKAWLCVVFKCLPQAHEWKGRLVL